LLLKGSELFWRSDWLF